MNKQIYFENLDKAPRANRAKGIGATPDYFSDNNRLLLMSLFDRKNTITDKLSHEKEKHCLCKGPPGDRFFVGEAMGFVRGHPPEVLKPPSERCSEYIEGCCPEFYPEPCPELIEGLVEGLVEESFPELVEGEIIKKEINYHIK